MKVLVTLNEMTKQAAPGLLQFIYYYYLLPSLLRTASPRRKLPFSLQKNAGENGMDRDLEESVCIVFSVTSVNDCMCRTLHY